MGYDIMNAVIYARYSSSAQREASIEEQIKVCSDYARREGYTVVDKYCDSAMTGRNDKRPALQKLLRDCTSDKFGVVIVYSIDRFGRNLNQTLNNMSIIESNGKSMRSATEYFTDDASGRFFRNLMMAYSQYYSDELAIKIKRGMDYNGEQCLSTGGKTALGYKVGPDKHFEIDPETAPIVRMIFEMYAGGKTVKEITDCLNSLGYKSSKGAEFNKNSLHTMLRNKRYIGIYTYKGKEYPGGIPRIISDELFEKVSEKMAKNKVAPARSRAKVEYLLTTKLFCGHCKEMMTGSSAKGMHGTVYYYYVCKGRTAKTCNKKNVKKSYIEDLVINECRKLLTAANIRRIAEEVSAICEAERDTSNLRYLQKSLADNQRKHDNALNAVLETDNPTIREGLYKKIEQLEAQQQELEAAIAQETAPFPSLTAPKIRFFLTSLKSGNINDIKYRKLLINIFVNKIFLYDDRVTITFNSGDDTVTINDRLLTELEENDAKVKSLFIDFDGPPTKKDRRWAVFLCWWTYVLCRGQRAPRRAAPGFIELEEEP